MFWGVCCNVLRDCVSVMVVPLLLLTTAGLFEVSAARAELLRPRAVGKRIIGIMEMMKIMNG